MLLIFFRIGKYIQNNSPHTQLKMPVFFQKSIYMSISKLTKDNDCYGRFTLSVTKYFFMAYVRMGIALYLLFYLLSILPCLFLQLFILFLQCNTLFVMPQLRHKRLPIIPLIRILSSLKGS